MALPLLAWPAIWAFISAIIKPVVKAVIVSLGLSLVVYTGLEIAFDEMFDYVNSGINSMPDMAIYVIKASGFLSAINMWAGAIAAVVTFRSMTGGAKMVWKKP